MKNCMDGCMMKTFKRKSDLLLTWAGSTAVGIAVVLAAIRQQRREAREKK